MEGGMPTNAEAVLQYIQATPGADDDQVAAATKVDPRQVRQIARQLEGEGKIRRSGGPTDNVLNHPLGGSPNSQPTPTPALEVVPSVLILSGVVLGIWSFFFSVTAPTDSSQLGVLASPVANLDLMGIRQMILTAGGFLFVGGWLAAIAARVDRIRDR